MQPNHLFLFWVLLVCTLPFEVLILDHVIPPVLSTWFWSWSLAICLFLACKSCYAAALAFSFLFSDTLQYYVLDPISQLHIISQGYCNAPHFVVAQPMDCITNLLTNHVSLSPA